MKYHVGVTAPARHDIGDIFAYLREHAPAFADRWLLGLYAAIATL